MAIRNLEGIVRNGNMEAEAKANAKQMRLDCFFHRVNKIKGLRRKCLDAVDTIVFLQQNGLYSKFSKWAEGKEIQFSYQYKSFRFGSYSTGDVSYRPLEDCVHFSWGDYGMYEGYDTNHIHSTRGNDYYAVERVYATNRTYNKNLTELATKLEPYIDAFFAWVDSLS